MKIYSYKLIVILILLVLMGACAKNAPKEEATLFDRLGGKESIQAVVSDFVELVRADERIKNQKVIDRMNTIDIDQLKALLVDQVCMGAGGPCEYKGRNMKESHVGLGISNQEFDYVVDDLVQILNKYKVQEKEQNELLAILGPMRPDIVEVK
jgi:hemoglobin